MKLIGTDDINMFFVEPVFVDTSAGIKKNNAGIKRNRSEASSMRSNKTAPSMDEAIRRKNEPSTETNVGELIQPLFLLPELNPSDLPSDEFHLPVKIDTTKLVLNKDNVEKLLNVTKKVVDPPDHGFMPKKIDPVKGHRKIPSDPGTMIQVCNNDW